LVKKIIREKKLSLSHTGKTLKAAHQLIQGRGLLDILLERRRWAAQ